MQNLVLCSTQRIGEVQLIHPDPEVISLRLMFHYFGLSQLMPVITRFPFEVHTLHHLLSHARVHPGVWSSIQTTSQLSWLWQWVWPILVCAMRPARPCSDGCDIIQSTSTYWREKTIWWDPQTPSAGCHMVPTWADMKGTVLKLYGQTFNTKLIKYQNYKSFLVEQCSFCHFRKIANIV